MTPSAHDGAEDSVRILLTKNLVALSVALGNRSLMGEFQQEIFLCRFGGIFVFQ